MIPIPMSLVPVLAPQPALALSRAATSASAVLLFSPLARSLAAHTLPALVRAPMPMHPLSNLELVTFTLAPLQALALSLVSPSRQTGAASLALVLAALV